jgi:hypothetical protein
MAEELCVRFLKGKDFRELLRLSAIAPKSREAAAGTSSAT